MRLVEPVTLGSGAPNDTLAEGFGWAGEASLAASSAGHEPGRSEASGSDEHAYRPELATIELIAEVRRLLATERRIERLVCRYLADLADRVGQRQDHALW